jgi:hypothetical protein
MAHPHPASYSLLAPDRLRSAERQVKELRTIVTKLERELAIAQRRAELAEEAMRRSYAYVIGSVVRAR